MIVTYTAGYAATPPEIAQACIELVCLRYKERDRIGQVSKNLAGEVVAFSQKDMPADVADVARSVPPEFRAMIALQFPAARP